MEMLERYLHAIEFWLPRDQRRDILAEISEDLHSQIEEHQAALGRPLNDAELEVLLRQRGRPMLVANRYRPQRSLIGPEWFPAYVFVLKIVGLCYVLPWLVTYAAVQRIQHPASNWGSTIVAAFSAGWTAAFFAAAVVTIVFAALQFTGAQARLSAQWSPRTLPLVRDPHKIPRANSVAEIVVNLAFVLWWMAHMTSPVLFDGPSFKLVLAPVWAYFFWAYLALALFNIALAVINLQKPHWSRPQAAARLVSDLAGGALFCWFFKANIISTLTIANLEPARALAVRDAIHLWMGRSLPIAIVVVAIIFTVDLFRVVRRTNPTSLSSIPSTSDPLRN